MLLVPTNFENAVNRPLAEWKSQSVSKSNVSVSIPEKKREIGSGIRILLILVEFKGLEHD